jgi:DMSO/TMAO reductase YedYZ molybdopterin-dependent catalytic subunit
MADSAPGWTTGPRDGRHANVAVRVDDVRVTATRDRPPLHAAIAGAVATLAALGASELAAGLLSAQSLVAAVGGAVIDLQPAGAKDFVVALFGQNDKLALELFIVGFSVLVGAALGLAARRSFMVGAGGFALFAGLGFFATLAEPSSVAAPAAIVAGVAAITGIQVLSWLLGPPSSPAAATPDEPPARGSMPDWSRRGFLLRSGSAAAVATVAGLGGRSLLEASRSLPASADTAIPPAGEVVTLPAGSSLPIDGLTPVVVPNNDFYRIDTALLTPNVDLPSWSLGIHGLVDRDTRLSYAELVELPLIEQYVTIACVSNEVGGNLVGNAKWTGVRLRDVLEIAGVQASATQLVGRSVDGWTAGMPTSWVMDPAREPMIAVKMNDEVLPRTHGFPARLIVPGLFGYVSATKWLSELELTTWESFDGYWVPLGWAKEGPILTQSRIDVPRNGGSVPADRVVIAGVAWAPDRGISKVEVAIDGQWRDCTLATPISDATWVQWNHAWDASAAGPGDHRIEVRATDGNGEIQSANVTPPAPDGARGYHSISVRIG